MATPWDNFEQVYQINRALESARSPRRISISHEKVVLDIATLSSQYGSEGSVSAATHELLICIGGLLDFVMKDYGGEAEVDYFPGRSGIPYAHIRIHGNRGELPDDLRQRVHDPATMLLIEAHERRSSGPFFLITPQHTGLSFQSCFIPYPDTGEEYAEVLTREYKALPEGERALLTNDLLAIFFSHIIESQELTV
ncbi:hypothetical protein M1555_05310 [Patescibacteria group bacterium]|nr:hypothetical protein [Patescibacteria group bacterium]